MLKSKTIDRICCVALAVMLAITGAVWVGKAQAGRRTHIEMPYEGLFDQSVVHTIDIVLTDQAYKDWDSFLADATQEIYAECTVTIDGEKISNVGIRGKGNTSLSSVSSMGSQKYSFKIEFNKYVKGRQYKGLDKLSLNNLIYDATMMKDYLAYTLMARAGVPTPMCSFAEITVDGEPWGLYLAVEGVEDSFMQRNNITTGELYKPDSMSFGGGRGNGRDFDFEQFRVEEEETDAEETKDSAPADESDQTQEETRPQKDGEQGTDPFGASFGGQASQDGFPGQMPGGFPGSDGFSLPEGFTMPENMGSGFQPPENPGGEGFSMPDGNFQIGGGMFNFGMGSSDVKLQYIDDNPESYSNIFNNSKTAKVVTDKNGESTRKVSTKDQTRLIEALKTLSGDNPRDAVFADEVISYLAVHDFLQNGDSYTGMMVHNYYLYEEDGRLAIIPWDYNLAFGGMGGGDASSTVNSPIDNPVSNGTGSDRPLIAWIFQDEEALAQYHAVYSQFIADTVESGWLAEEIDRVAALIRPYVEADENSFYPVEEFDTAVDAIQTYCDLRGQSVRGQLDGTIPSTSDGQRKDSASLVDASGLSITAMGSMNNGNSGGMGPGGGGFTMPSGFQRPGGQTDGGQTPEEAQTSQDAGAEQTAQPSQTDPAAGQIPGSAGADFSGSNGGQAPANGAAGADFSGSNGGQAPANGAAGADFSGSNGGQAPANGTAGADFSGSNGGQAPANGELPTETPAVQQTTDGTARPDASENVPDSQTNENAEDGQDAKADQAAGDAADSKRPRDRQSADRGQMPPDGFRQGAGTSAAQQTEWIVFGVCAGLLLAAVMLLTRLKGHND